MNKESRVYRISIDKKDYYLSSKTGKEIFSFLNVFFSKAKNRKVKKIEIFCCHDATREEFFFDVFSEYIGKQIELNQIDQSKLIK